MGWWHRSGRRVAVALAVGVAAGGWEVANVFKSGEVAVDFTWPWRAARALLDGRNPYEVITPTGKFPFDAYFKYPLPAALLALPAAPLPGEYAAGVFVGLSVALLTWAVTRADPARGLENRWPLLLSGCVFSAVRSAQWSPLLAAGLLLSPWAVGLGVVKPNLGVALFAARPGWRPIVTGSVLLAVSLLVLPGWPADWLRILRSNLEPHYRSPVAGGPGVMALGPLLLAVAFRWRRPEARLLLAMACLPQVPTFYDQLLVLVTVARTRTEAALLAVPSAVSATWLFADPTIHHDQSAAAVLLTVYFPALVLILQRPNRNDPPW